ncbi:hypothetical protein H17ap60334_03200 [Thermosipho africanus H17ap60334]|uniref:hypothetical protein n=1 Tax=Thermosipho africanus TaxID=2421 RepID=UPI00028EC5A3|nr:hypothetical protein [Thermosipho africanus]EKF49727.1 hypothetical protein H17ap60334_03200 [Thermosipho africanus H17ap60334]
MQSKSLYSFLELSIINLIIFILDLLFKNYGYITVNPNPYLILNLYVAIRYGTNIFFASAALSTFFYFLSLHIQYGLNVYLILFSWPVLKIPLFILSLGFLIAFFRDSYVQTINEQEEKIKILSKKIETLEDTIRKYENLTNDLQNKLLLENKGVSIFVDKLKDIEYNNPEDIFNEAVELIYDFIEAKTVSIYTLSNNDFLRLKVRKGPQILPNSFPLEKSKVLSTAKDLGFASASILYLSNVDIDFSFEPALASKIEHTGKILGFIVIENIDPEKINKNTETYLKILSDWLSNMLYVSSELEEQIIKNDLEKFNFIFEKIEERFERFKIPYSFIKAKIKENSNIENIKRFIRETDFVFFDEKNSELKIVLTSCNSKGLKRVLDKLKDFKQIEIEEAYTKE